jgi:formate hydrogenlyase subunit 3/multisubunit Na+/H+ antiporter MnhD subunit
LFLSEFTIVRAGFRHSSPLAFALLALLVLAFIAFARTTTAMVTGEPETSDGETRQSLVAAVPLLAGMAALLLLGLWIPGGLNGLILHSIGAIR